MKRFNPGDLVTNSFYSECSPQTETLSIVLSYKSEDDYYYIFDINNFTFIELHYSFLKKSK